MEIRFASKRDAFPRSPGGVVLVLHDQSLVAKWEHRRVYPEKSEGQSITAGKRSL